MSNHIISRAILGQEAVELGTLFNAFENKPIADTNIFASAVPEDLVKAERKTVKMVAVARSSSKHENIAALALDSETGASVAVEGCDLGGASKALTKSTPSNNVMQNTAVCTLQKRTLSLVLDRKRIKPLVDLQSLEAQRKTATHVIVGIQEGARLAVTFQSTTKDLAQNFGRELEQLTLGVEQSFRAETFDYSAISPGATLDSLATSYEIKVFTDLSTKPARPVTYKSVCEYAGKFAGNKSETIQPLSVRLMPVQDFVQLARRESDLSRGVTLASSASIEEKVLLRVISVADKIEEAKRVFNDCIAEFEANPQHVPASQVAKWKAKAPITNYQETALAEIRQELTAARDSGEASSLVEMLDAHEKAVSDINAKFTSWTTKLRTLGELKALGVGVSTLKTLLGYPDTTTTTTTDASVRGNVYLFFVSAAATGSPDWDVHKQKALSLVATHKVLIVDLDTDQDRASAAVSAPCLQFRRNGKIAVSDVLADELRLEGMCLLRCKPGSPLKQDVPTSPEKRLYVFIKCPGEKCAKTATSSWICGTCREQVGFGHDTADRFYCGCGSYDIGLAEFRCRNRSCHGPAFSGIPVLRGQDADTVQQVFSSQLRQMGPFEQVNILVVGEVGTGKSTFINAFFNYLAHDTLRDALNAEDFALDVPGSHAVPDPAGSRGKPVTITWGAPQGMVPGQPTTQLCTIYSKVINGKLVRLVDTPGLQNEQSSKHVTEIIKACQSVSSISSILFLMDNNKTNLEERFEFVIKPITNNVTRRAYLNVMIGFTRGRTTSPPFSAGTTGLEVFRLMAQKMMPFPALAVDANLFVFDAEGFLYAAAWHKNRLMLTSDRDTIAESWKMSAERARLFLSAVDNAPVYRTNAPVMLEKLGAAADTLKPTIASMASKTVECKRDLTNSDNLEMLGQLKFQDVSLSYAMAMSSVYVEVHSKTRAPDAMLECLDWLAEDAKKERNDALCLEYAARKEAHELLVQQMRDDIQQGLSYPPLGEDVLRVMLESQRQRRVVNKIADDLLVDDL